MWGNITCKISFNSLLYSMHKMERGDSPSEKLLKEPTFPTFLWNYFIHSGKTSNAARNKHSQRYTSYTTLFCRLGTASFSQNELTNYHFQEKLPNEHCIRKKEANEIDKIGIEKFKLIGSNIEALQVMNISYLPYWIQLPIKEQLWRQIKWQ